MPPRLCRGCPPVPGRWLPAGHEWEALALSSIWDSPTVVVGFCFQAHTHQNSQTKLSCPFKEIEILLTCFSDFAEALSDIFILALRLGECFSLEGLKESFPNFLDTFQSEGAGK